MLKVNSVMPGVMTNEGFYVCDRLCDIPSESKVNMLVSAEYSGDHSQILNHVEPNPASAELAGSALLIYAEKYYKHCQVDAQIIQREIRTPGWPIVLLALKPTFDPAVTVATPTSAGTVDESSKQRTPALVTSVSYALFNQSSRCVRLQNITASKPEES